jgi:hypothetical protein
MVSFLLTEFRRHIIPQTCALIFLQGQIRNGIVSPEEFPLNLWDMERMYEGIYQYLEFFAILTEHERWKVMMGDWEITCELVTLLEELDAAIPRATARNPKVDWEKRAASRALAPQPMTPVPGPVLPDVKHPPVAVERPYDPQAGIGAAPELPTSQLPPTAPPTLEDEPSDFEWRNLKKLAVLVLSSLVWKSRNVQEQLGAAGPLDELKGRGIRALLNCCKVDDYNPYIREHAIMALRFALEGNKENQDIVRNLERLGQETPTLGTGGTATMQQHATSGAQAQAGPSAIPNGGGGTVPGTSADRATITTATGMKVEVPKEVLDLNGYETFVDVRGQVQLKKRDARGKVPAMTMMPPLEARQVGDDHFM